jgi:hypothetical protein
MPLAPCLLAALTPDEHDIRLVDMFFGDSVDYQSDVDVVAMTVRTPLATIAYEIADNFLGGARRSFSEGRTFSRFPKRRSGMQPRLRSARELWPQILKDIEGTDLKQIYVCGPYAVHNLKGTVHHIPQRPSLEKPGDDATGLAAPQPLYDGLHIHHARLSQPLPVLSRHRHFRGKIRHRPIDLVVAEVSTLGPRYYNFDDSVFGHPQIVDRPEENQYYLDLYGGAPASKTPVDGRGRAFGGELQGWQADSGARSRERPIEHRCRLGVHLRSGPETLRGLEEAALHVADSFDVQKMQENVRAIQSLGIEVRGFFVIGWDDDTAETYQRTLEFCDECGITPFIFTLTPMLGSQIYHEYQSEGRIYSGRGWGDYGTGPIVYRHPLMSQQEIFDRNAEVMTQGHSLGRILKRTIQAFRNRPSLEVAKDSFFTQLGVRKAYPQLYVQVPKPSVACVARLADTGFRRDGPS